MYAERLWDSIVKYIRKNKTLQLLSESSKSQQFEIITVYPDYIVIRFSKSGNHLKLEKERFTSAYKMLEENKGKWVNIGARRVETKYDTLEGRVKNDYNGDLNGLSTAPWLAAILVGTFGDIIFNDKKRGQALMMTKKELR